LAGTFHGLRPLIVALDTTCEPLLRYWQKLTVQSACSVVRVEGGWGATANLPYRESRLEAVARQVIVEGAHFGAWIDGQGECLCLVDERGEPVESWRVSLLLRSFLKRHNPDAVFLCDSADTRQSPRDARQQTCERMTASQAVFGSDGDRYWLAGSPAVPDALATLCLLLKLLSESDRTLSEVLDAVAAAE